MNVQIQISDPALAKTVRGLLALEGLREAGSGPGETGSPPVLKILDAEAAGVPGPAILLCREDDPAGQLPGTARLDLPLSLPEAFDAIRNAVRPVDPVPAGAGLSSSGARPEHIPGGDPGGKDGLRDSPITEQDPAPLSDGVLLDPAERTVTWQRESVRLSPREFALFGILFRRRGETVPREDLTAAFGGLGKPGGPGRSSRSNPADVYVGYLRRKLRPLFGPGAILSVRGQGYVLRLPGLL